MIYEQVELFNNVSMIKGCVQSYEKKIYIFQGGFINHYVYFRNTRNS